MNDKFFGLPLEKQQRIINASFRVFANNSYKKSPVGDIAKEAGISKSLLFHYFHNKKELYMFIWEKCAEITVEALKKYGCYEPEDMFEAMYLGLKAKMEIMREYPDIGRFAIKAYYEKDPEVAEDIAKFVGMKSELGVTGQKKWFDSKQFIPGLDLEMMYKDMFLALEGLVWERMNQNKLDVDEMEKEYYELISFWKKVYLRHEGD